MSDLSQFNTHAVVATLGLGAITLFTRTFFFLVKSDWQLPPIVEAALRYAPLAALGAVVLPEVWSQAGDMRGLLYFWRDAKIYGTLACVGYFYWRKDVLGAILSGSAVYLALRLGLGWGLG